MGSLPVAPLYLGSQLNLPSAITEQVPVPGRHSYAHSRPGLPLKMGN